MRVTAPARIERMVRRLAPTRGGVIIACVSIAILIFMIGQVIVGATQIGNSNDDPGHQARTHHWLENGWYLPGKFFEENGDVRGDIETGRLHAYGASFSVFAHATASVLGVEPLGTTASTASAFIARHLAVGLLGVAAALAVGYAILVVTERRSIGLWAAAATVALPLWAGHSMFAVKDVPAAAGWTFFSSALCVALVPGSSRWRPAVVGLLSFSGVWFAIGTRIALWVPLAVATVTFACLATLSLRRRSLIPNIVAVGAGMVSGFVAVAALHYRNISTPAEWLLSAVRTSGDFRHAGATLTAGQVVSTKPPWWYLPAWIGGSVPLLIGLMALIGLMLVIARLGMRPRQGVGPLRGRIGTHDAGMLLFVLQALLLPTVATIGGATMYSGLRQHLYVLPALAALAGFAAHWLTGRFRERLPRIGIVALLVVAVAAPAIEQTALFPYNYIYKNVAAGSINDRWDTDTQWVSSREGLTYVPTEERAMCYTTSTRTSTGEILQPDLRSCSSRQQIGVFQYEKGTNTRSIETGGRVWVLAPKYQLSPPANGCTEAGNVTRRFRGEDVVISYVLLCDSSMLDQ